VKRLIPVSPTAVAASPAAGLTKSALAEGRKEATVILTLLVAAGAVLLAVFGRALLAPNDDIRL